MIRTVRRQLSLYGAMAAMVPKLFMAYQIWFWMQFVVQVIALVVLVSFWTAVYANSRTLSGLALNQTLNYIILAQIFLPAIDTNIMLEFGYLLREGQMGIELLRPIDFQLGRYAQTLTFTTLALALQLPLALVGWLLFRFQVPADPLVWLAFLVTLLLGSGLLFCFDWMLACLSFYTTEAWGLGVLRFGVAMFFSGSLIPLDLMPDWLAGLTAALPFAQALYMPVSLLSGITPLAQAPRIWLTQLAYLVALALLSRLVFRVTVRRVTVQGG